MLQAELKRPAALTAQDIADWRRLQHATPPFDSPLLGPDFAQAVGRVRDDARVALWRRRGRLVGVLAHHRRPLGLARPIGAPWSDLHALITTPQPDFGWREAFKAAGLRSFRFSRLVDPHGLFAGVAGEGPCDYVLESDGPAYWERLRAGSPKRFKNMRRLEHKLAREVGPLTFGPERDRAAFAALLDWKRAQLNRTGAHDVLHPAWSRALMRAAFDTQGEAFSGLLLTLRAGGKLVAAHFGVRAAGAYHPWIAAYDPQFAPYSPGLTFLSFAVREAPRLGLSQYELSSGSDHYKAVFAPRVRGLGGGAADRLTRISPAAVRPLSMSRLRRRFDLIAETDPSFGGRLHGLAMTLAHAPRRWPLAGALAPGDAL